MRAPPWRRKRPLLFGSSFLCLQRAPPARLSGRAALTTYETQVSPARCSPCVAGSGEGRRFIDAPDQAREALSEPLPLLLRQKAPNLAPVAMRLDGQATRVQGRLRAAKFNACPMPRKHNFYVMRMVAGLDAHIGLGNDDGFAVIAAPEAHLQRPAEE